MSVPVYDFDEKETLPLLTRSGYVMDGWVNRQLSVNTITDPSSELGTELGYTIYNIRRLEVINNQRPRGQPYELYAQEHQFISCYTSPPNRSGLGQDAESNHLARSVEPHRHSTWHGCCFVQGNHVVEIPTHLDNNNRFHVDLTHMPIQEQWRSGRRFGRFTGPSTRIRYPRQFPSRVPALWRPTDEDLMTLVNSVRATRCQCETCMNHLMQNTYDGNNSLNFGRESPETQGN